MRTPLVLIIGLAACHHEASSPAPAAPAHAPAVHRAPHAMAMREPAPTDADCDRLAAELRTTPLADRIDGALVVLDGDAGAVRTECGFDATETAASIGRSLVDPKSAAPRCQIQGERIVCAQEGTRAGDPHVDLYFEREGGWKLTGAVRARVNQPLRGAWIDQFGIRLGNARCPGE